MYRMPDITYVITVQYMYVYIDIDIWKQERPQSYHSTFSDTCLTQQLLVPCEGHYALAAKLFWE